MSHEPKDGWAGDAADPMSDLRAVRDAACGRCGQRTASGHQCFVGPSLLLGAFTAEYLRRTFRPDMTLEQFLAHCGGQLVDPSLTAPSSPWTAPHSPCPRCGRPTEGGHERDSTGMCPGHGGEG